MGQIQQELAGWALILEEKGRPPMYAENELLFPSQIIPRLRRERGPAWQSLVASIAGMPEDSAESLAFSLMMIRINGCLSCETDSYRAMRGCLPCTSQVLRRHRASDEELLARYSKALEDIRAYLAANPQALPDIQVLPAQAA
jgi:hypothetical protein